MSMHFSKEAFSAVPAITDRDWFNFRSRAARNVVAFNPTKRMIKSLLAKAAATISPMATMATVLRVYERNPDTVVAFARGSYVENDTADRPIGMLCQLPLNADGYKALFDHRLNTIDPQDQFIARQNERPAAIYYWCMYADDGIGGGLELAVERTTSDRYRGLPAYCRAANEKAREFLLTMGFVDGADYQGGDAKIHLDEFMQYVPTHLRPSWPKYDSYVPNSGPPDQLSVTVARSPHDLWKAMSMRGGAYLENRFLPYNEDDDGNDCSAIHLIGYVGDDPAGCLRIRCFPGFVKFERLAVARIYRGGRLSLRLIRAGIDFARAMGYSHIYGQAAVHALPIWKYFKFVQRPGDGIEYMTDERYYEIDLILPPPVNPITPYSGANVLVRPVGRWHVPGPFEQRAAGES